jgi:hypothetical protein
MQKRTINTLFILTLLLYFTACDANLDYKNMSGDIRLHPSIVVPIGSASVSVLQVLSLDTAIDINTTSNDVYYFTLLQTQYVYQDTVGNFFSPMASAIDSIKNAQFTYAEVVLNVINGFPIDAKLQLIPLDTLGNVISTDFANTYSITGGTIDSNGLVTAGNEKTQIFRVSLSNKQLQDLRKAQNLAYKLEINVQSVNSNIYFSKSELFTFQAGFFASAIVTTTFK